LALRVLMLSMSSFGVDFFHGFRCCLFSFFFPAVAFEKSVPFLIGLTRQYHFFSDPFFPPVLFPHGPPVERVLFLRLFFFV